MCWLSKKVEVLVGSEFDFHDLCPCSLKIKNGKQGGWNFTGEKEKELGKAPLRERNRKRV